MRLLGVIQHAGEIANVLIVAFVAYMLLVKSALSTLWWPLAAPVLEPLGVRLVCMDRSFHLYSVRYVGRDTA